MLSRETVTRHDAQTSGRRKGCMKLKGAGAVLGTKLAGEHGAAIKSSRVASDHDDKASGDEAAARNGRSCMACD